MTGAQIVFEQDQGRSILTLLAKAKRLPARGEIVAGAYGYLLTPEHAVDRHTGDLAPHAKGGPICGVCVVKADDRYHVASFKQGGAAGSRRYHVSVPVDDERDAWAEAFDHQVRLITWARRRFKVVEG